MIIYVLMTDDYERLTRVEFDGETWYNAALLGEDNWRKIPAADPLWLGRRLTDGEVVLFLQKEGIPESVLAKETLPEPRQAS